MTIVTSVVNLVPRAEVTSVARVVSAVDSAMSWVHRGSRNQMVV
jgi:hypothetical protein